MGVQPFIGVEPEVNRQFAGDSYAILVPGADLRCPLFNFILREPDEITSSSISRNSLSFVGIGTVLQQRGIRAASKPQVR